jgi:hypothetical protein
MSPHSPQAPSTIARALFAGSPQFGSGALTYGLEYLRNDGPWDHPNDFTKWNGVLRYAQGAAANGFALTGWRTRPTGARPTRSRAARSMRA